MKLEMAYTIFIFIWTCLWLFYNVVGLRVPQKESIVHPPSHCPKCQRRLTVLDLVPVLSYVFLGGKCRSCGNKISWVYPFIELMTGVLFAFAYWQLGWGIELIVAFFLSPY